MIIPIVITFAALAAAGALIFRFLIPRWVFNLYTKPIRLPNKLHPSEFGIDSEDITFKLSDINLTGWILKPKKYLENAPHPTVIMPHGIAANRSDILPRSAFLVNQGFLICSFDWRGHGDSGGKRSSAGLLEKDDLLQVIKQIDQRQDVDSSRLAIYGFSMGAAISIIAAAEADNIRCLVADSPYADLWRISGYMLGKMLLPADPLRKYVDSLYRKEFGSSMRNVKPELAIKSISPEKLLLIGGQEDKLVPHENFLELQQATNGEAESYLTPGGHFSNGEEEILNSVILPFLRKHLS